MTIISSQRPVADVAAAAGRRGALLAMAGVSLVVGLVLVVVVAQASSALWTDAPVVNHMLALQAPVGTAFDGEIAGASNGLLYFGVLAWTATAALLLLVAGLLAFFPRDYLNSARRFAGLGMGMALALAAASALPSSALAVAPGLQAASSVSSAQSTVPLWDWIPGAAGPGWLVLTCVLGLLLVRVSDREPVGIFVAGGARSF